MKSNKKVEIYVLTIALITAGAVLSGCVTPINDEGIGYQQYIIFYE